jgi:flagellar protein FlaG
MGSDISNISPSGAGLGALRSTSQTPNPGHTSGIQVPEVPKVQAPKPIAIHFDPAEVRQTVQDAVRLLNQQMSTNNRGLGFHIDESLEQPVVTVRSTTTGEVVRQIPSEVVVNVAHNLDRMKGLLFSAKI